MMLRAALATALALAVAGCANDGQPVGKTPLPGTTVSVEPWLEGLQEEAAAPAPAPVPVADDIPVAEGTLTTPFYGEWGEPPPDGEELDAFDPEYSLLPDSEEAERRLLDRLGDRADFKVPLVAVRGLKSGALAHAVVARLLAEVPPEVMTEARWRRLTPGQRALYAISVADAEILNGGLGQLWWNASGWVAPDLTDAALRVGARRMAAIFERAEALFPGGVIPRNDERRLELMSRIRVDAVTPLDEAYGDLQYHRATHPAPALGAYVRNHPGEFFTG